LTSLKEVSNRKIAGEKKLSWGDLCWLWAIPKIKTIPASKTLAAKSSPIKQC